MRRIGGLWEQLISMDTLERAAKIACASRKNKKEVKEFEKRKDELLHNLQTSVINHTYKSSEYRMFKVNENGKERDVADLPLYPDRIFHWALALVLEKPMNSKLIDQTHASRPGHGIHSAMMNVNKYIVNDSRAVFYLKCDVRKFFPSIDKEILKSKLRHVLKDSDILTELDKLINQYPYSGLPIGNRTSPMLANLYLSEIDHMMKEKHHVHYYVRYMDDIVILGYSRPWLKRIRDTVASYLSDIGLNMKPNWIISAIDPFGIDFVGYRIFSDHILLRKRIKLNLKKAVKRMIFKLKSGDELDVHDKGAIASYTGFLMWCNGYNLYRSTIYEVLRLRECRRMDIS